MSKTYERAGVSIDSADLFTQKIKSLADSTNITGVIGSIGFFGGFFEAPKAFINPVLVSGTDSVGTKVKIAQMLDKHDTVGIDCVAMNVDDIVCSGAKPLFFLDYLAVNKLDIDVSYEIIKGIVHGCKLSECALIGGETAQLGDIYLPGEYDLVGFAVGIVEKENIIDGSRIVKGDLIIGLPSSGFHSNGYSLVRKIISRFKLDQSFEEIPNLGLALLEPTIIYTPAILKIIKAAEIHGISHITGGGLADNLPRIIKAGKAVVEKFRIVTPPIIQFIVKEASISVHEAYRTFNMGVGMALFAPEKDVTKIMSIYPGAMVIGHVDKADKPEFELK